jgi:hypothetical protein
MGHIKSNLVFGTETGAKWNEYARSDARDRKERRGRKPSLFLTGVEGLIGEVENNMWSTQLPCTEAQAGMSRSCDNLENKRSIKSGSLRHIIS